MGDTLYSALATAWGGREGRVATSDNKLSLQLSFPKELGGDGVGTNPEQLFAAGYSACFHSALKLIAAQRNIDVSESAVSVTVNLLGGDGFSIGAKIEAELPGIDHESALDLVAAAHEVCPYSKATRGNIPVELSVTQS
jgi:osmotically inducible protein OsmC